MRRRGKKQDWTGRVFGHLTVLEEASQVRVSGKSVRRWRCRCACGTIKIINCGSLHCGDTKTCGAGCPYRIGVHVGQRFERLTVLAQAEYRHRKAHFLCRCDCGKELVVDACNLKDNHTRSCGCFKDDLGAGLGKSSRTHGHSKTPDGPKIATPTYRTWNGMHSRCHNSNHKGYKNYGGRGITVCERWRNNFPNFLADMGEKPGQLKAREFSIDRIDNDKGYYKENCRWTTPKVQAGNRRKAKRAT